MNERLLQFIWQHQYFNRTNLRTHQGEELEIIYAGKWNTNQGPDFTEAKIRIHNTVWAGNIELHVQSSDWNKHNHQQDTNYRNIILHVVWIDDLQSGQLSPAFPTLELEPRISKLLLRRYEELSKQVVFVPCEKHIQPINELLWYKWKQRLLMERLQRKSLYITSLLSQNQYHWEETLWWMIAKNFGGKLNGDAFESVAKTISLKILSRHKSQVLQLEALLLGQAGLLDEALQESYPVMLQKEYRFLRNKYTLQQPAVAMKFLRMRPSGFPSLRLAQLAVLVSQSSHLFSQMKESVSLYEIRKLLDVKANDYWHYHYRFGEAGAFKHKNLGSDMIDNILINSIIPIIYCFGCHQNQPAYQEKAIAWLEKIPAEKNQLTKGWLALELPLYSSYDSQALLELKTRYCETKRCLDCAVGIELLRGGVG